MELILVRHGLPERTHVQEDSTDSGLTDEGYGRADHPAERPATELIDAIYVGPMAQACETGGPIHGSR